MMYRRSTYALLLLLFIGTVCVTATGLTPPVKPADPFGPWTGRWKGEFVCYDIQGKQKYRLEVEQRYEPAGEGQQGAVFMNRSGDGSVEIIHAVNLVRGGALICRTRTIGPDGKALSEPIEHRGTYISQGHIIWHRRIGDRGFETFNEVIDGNTFWIHGVALHSDDPREIEIYEGRYTRVED